MRKKIKLIIPLAVVVTAALVGIYALAGRYGYLREFECTSGCLIGRHLKIRLCKRGLIPWVQSERKTIQIAWNDGGILSSTEISVPSGVRDAWTSTARSGYFFLYVERRGTESTSAQVDIYRIGPDYIPRKAAEYVKRRVDDFVPRQYVPPENRVWEVESRLLMTGQATSRQGMPVGSASTADIFEYLNSGYDLVFEDKARSVGRGEILIRVWDKGAGRGNPGWQPQIIQVLDQEQCVLSAKEVGGGPCMVGALLEPRKNSLFLYILVERNSDFVLQVNIYEITADDSIQERAVYSEKEDWRRAGDYSESKQPGTRRPRERLLRRNEQDPSILGLYRFFHPTARGWEGGKHRVRGFCGRRVCAGAEMMRPEEGRDARRTQPPHTRTPTRIEAGERWYH